MFKNPRKRHAANQNFTTATTKRGPKKGVRAARQPPSRNNYISQKTTAEMDWCRGAGRRAQGAGRRAEGAGQRRRVDRAEGRGQGAGYPPKKALSSVSSHFRPRKPGGFTLRFALLRRLVETLGRGPRSKPRSAHANGQRRSRQFRVRVQGSGFRV